MSKTQAVRRPPKDLLARIAKLEREHMHLQKTGHRTFNWRPRLARVERQLSKARQELREYSDG